MLATVYPGYVSKVFGSGVQDLPSVLAELRREVRISQVELSRLAGLSRETVNLIERDMTRPKVDTLRRLANGLATNGAGVRNAELADGYYERLMRAAGYIKADSDLGDPGPLVRRPVDDLTDDEVVDELERRMGDREVAVSLLAAANNWRELPPRARRLVLDTIRFAGGEEDEALSGERRQR